MESPTLLNDVVLRRYFAAAAGFIGIAGLVGEAAGWFSFVRDLNASADLVLSGVALATTNRPLEPQALLVAKICFVLIVFWLACFAGLHRYVVTYERTTLPKLIDEVNFLQVDANRLEWVRVSTTAKLFILLPLYALPLLIVYPFRRRALTTIVDVPVAPLVVLREAVYLILLLLAAAMVVSQAVRLATTGAA